VSCTTPYRSQIPQAIGIVLRAGEQLAAAGVALWNGVRCIADACLVADSRTSTDVTSPRCVESVWIQTPLHRGLERSDNVLACLLACTPPCQDEAYLVMSQNLTVLSLDLHESATIIITNTLLRMPRSLNPPTR